MASSLCGAIMNCPWGVEVLRGRVRALNTLSTRDFIRSSRFLRPENSPSSKNGQSIFQGPARHGRRNLVNNNAASSMVVIG